MKTFQILYFVILSSIISFGQKNQQRAIFVFSVNFFTSTFVTVPCENFATTFKDRIKTNEVYSKDSVEMLDKWLKDLKFSKENKVLNTRAKFRFVNKLGGNVTICMDMFDISIDGNLIEKNQELFQFLRSLIPKEQLSPQPQRESFAGQRGLASICLLRPAGDSCLNESRREWLLRLMEEAGTANRQNKNFRLWQQDNRPIPLITARIAHQKLDYIHNNPVEAGIVEKAEDYLYSSAKDYFGMRGLIDVILLDPLII